MAWQFILLYGFRPGEVYGLRWEDITESQININQAYNDRGQITGGKNKNAIRTECIIPLAEDILARARE